MGQIKNKIKVRVSIRTSVPNLGAVRRERFLTIDNPLNPPGVGWVKFFKVRVFIRTCVPNLGVVRHEISHACQIWARCGPTAPGVGLVRIFLAESQSGLYRHMRAKFGRDLTAGSKKVSFKFIILGVRSLANASRATV